MRSFRGDSLIGIPGSRNDEHLLWNRNMLAARDLNHKLPPAMRHGIDAAPFGNRFGFKHRAAHGGNFPRDKRRSAQLIEKCSDHGSGNDAIFSGTPQEPIWHDQPDNMGDDQDMPKKPTDFARAAGERLRRCRLFLGLSQQEFAEVMEISRTAYENAEAGRNCVQPEAVELARKRFRITHDWIYAGDPYLLPDDMKKAVTAPQPVQMPERQSIDARHEKRRKRSVG